MWTVSAAPQAFLQLKGFNSTVQASKLTVRITTQAAIPTNGKHGAFGYAVLTGGFSRVLILVTHLGINDSKFVRVGGFHTHVLDLMEPSANCAGHTAEVNLASAKMANFDPGFQFAIRGNSAVIGGVPASALKGSRVEGVAAFTVKPVFNGKKLTDLCVDVVSKLPK